MIEGKFAVYGAENLLPNGCTWYRIKQPLLHCIRQDLFPCALSNGLSYQDQTTWIDGCDILFSQIATRAKFLEYVKEQRHKKKFVLDFDDNIFEVSPYNPSYDKYGICEVDYHVGGKTVHLRNGENGLNIEENIKRLDIFRETCVAVDMILTPSPVLASVFKEFNDNVRVIKNCLNFDDWYPIEMVKDDKIRIVWQGGFSHYEDWWEIRDVLLGVMSKHPQVNLIVMGENFGGLFDGFDKNRFEFHPWINIDAYPYKFKTLRADIGIIPLKNSKFNRCKSEIKWEEYSALSIPTIASNFPPYSSNIRHNETGLLASNEQEWREYLELLINDKEKRKKLGTQAMEFVRENYDVKKVTEQYDNNFKSLFKKELVII